MNGLALLAILLLSTVPLYAQAQQPGTAKLKADAQKVVGSIRGDKAKSQTYCELDTLSGQIDQAAQRKDTKKVDALSQRADELEKQLAPEYRTLFADPGSKDVQDILSMFDARGTGRRHWASAPAKQLRIFRRLDRPLSGAEWPSFSAPSCNRLRI